MSEWVLLALGGLNVLLLLGLWRRSTAAPDAQSAQNAQDLRAAEQTAWQQQQFAAVLAQTYRLERALRTEISQSGVQGGKKETKKTTRMIRNVTPKHLVERKKRRK